MNFTFGKYKGRFLKNQLLLYQGDLDFFKNFKIESLIKSKKTECKILKERILKFPTPTKLGFLCGFKTNEERQVNIILAFEQISTVYLI